MREYRHLYTPAPLPVFFFMACLSFSGCRVYTIKKSDLETHLKPVDAGGGLSLNNLYKKQYHNNIDTLLCVDEIGQVKTRRFGRDSKIKIYTRRNKAIKYYVKSLYIY